MRKFIVYSVVFVSIIFFQGCGTANVENMSAPKFIEIIVQNHLVSHGFDENNKEILEEVEVANPRKKLIRVDRIQSVSEKYILTSYGYGRLVYWEYEGSYDDMQKLLMSDSGQ